jgi:hypothetical protein
MNISLLKSGLTVGLLTGFFFILLFVTLFSLDTSFTSLMYDVDLGLMVFFVFITLIYFRDYNNYQEMKFTQGLLSGAITTVVSSLIMAVFILLLLNYICPDALADDVRKSIDGLMILNDKGDNVYVSLYGQEEFDLQMEAFKTVKVEQLAIKKLFSISIVGFIFTIVFSIFLRKKYDTEA